MSAEIETLIEGTGLTREDIRMVLDSRPNFRLADILAAFTEAIEHRYARMRACPDCRRPPGGEFCQQHEADVHQTMTYRYLRESFERAPADADEFATITRAIARGNTPTPREQMLAALDGQANAAGPSQPASPPGNAGFIYVIKFSNGTVKVGRSQDLERRLAAHRSHGRKFGADITDQWVSPQHTEWRQNETKLIAIAHELGGRVTAAEYFTGLAFADIVARAQDLPFTSCPAAT